MRYHARTMVHIEVKDEYAVNPRMRESFASSDGNVVKVAEAHGALAAGVMPRWTHNSECSGHSALSHEVGGFAHAASSD